MKNNKRLDNEEKTNFNEKDDKVAKIGLKISLDLSPILEIGKAFSERIKPFQIAMQQLQQLLFEQISSISEAFEAFGKAVNSMMDEIDWDSLREALRDKLKNWEEFMIHYEKDCWAVDGNMLDAFEDGEYKSNDIEKYVEDHINEYIEFFNANSLYSRHSSLINEAYELYNLGYYKHCTFSLLAVFDYILANTFKDYSPNTLPKKVKNKPKQYDKISAYIKTTDDELAFDIMFFRRVYNVYDIIFKPCWNQHPEQLNRNWIAHGLYEYDKIGKSDVLKLFQLLKATSILNDISFVKAEVS